MLKKKLAQKTYCKKSSLFKIYNDLLDGLTYAMYIIATINIESKKLVNSKPENHFVSSFLILFLLKNTVTSKLAIKKPHTGKYKFVI